MIHGSGFVWTGAGRQSRQGALWGSVADDPIVGSRMKEWSRNCTCQDPCPSALGKSWNEGGVAPPWNLIDLPPSPVRRFISSLRDLALCRSRRHAVSRRWWGWTLLPPLALTRPHLGSPVLCCTSRLYRSHSRRCSLRNFQDIVDPPYVVAIILKSAFWALVSSSVKQV